MVYYRLYMTAKLIINCISGDSTFTKEVYDYLYTGLEKQRAFEDSKDIRISKELITISEEDNSQIYIDRSALVPNGMIKWILQSYLKTNPAKFKDFDVIEIANTFTIGRILHPSKIEELLLTCDMCSYITPYEEQLLLHRMTHGNVMIG